MITTVLGLLGLAGSAAGALGSLGGIFKLLSTFLPSAAATVLSNPITGAVAKFAEGFFDLLWWGAKAVLGWLFTRIGNALDHIFSNGFAGVVFIASIILAYEVGGWGKPAPRAEAKSPPVTRSAPSTPVPKASVPRPVQKQQTPSVSLNPLDWLGINLFH